MILNKKRDFNIISNDGEAAKKPLEGSLNNESTTSTTLDISTSNKEVFNEANENHDN